MKVQAAAISLGGTNFVVALVGTDLVDNTGEADMAIDNLSLKFGKVPVVLMAQTDQGSPRYYGDQKLVELLRGVPVDQMPWQEFSIS